MKRNLLRFGLILALVSITVGTVGCESLSPPSTTSAQRGMVFSQQSTGIWVTGEGKVTVVPDVAVLSLGVEAQAATVAEAQGQMAAAMDAVFRELGNYGVAQKDIKTRHFSIYPVRKWVPKEEKEVFIGYRVNNMVTAKIREIEDTGGVIDSVTRAGGDYIRINSINLTVDDPTKYHQEAREKAMADAEDKAKQLADASGVKLGSPTYINESGGITPVPRFYGAVEAAPMPAPAPPPTPIAPGETEISLTVQVVYSIK